MQFGAEDIRILRRYTGDYFTAKNGYNFRKRLSPSRTRTVNKYLDKIREMTHGHYALITPERGQKNELFSYTGQKGYGKFAVAIVKTPKKTKTKVIYDKSLPKGHRIAIDYPNISQREVKISKQDILYFLSIEDQEGLKEYIEQKAPDAKLFLINTDGGSMWQRTADDAYTVADFIFELAEKYGTQNFTRATYSHFDNWIESITAFTNVKEADKMISENAQRQADNRAHFSRMGQSYNLRYSDVHDAIFETDNGELLRVYGRASIERALKDAWTAKKKKRRKSGVGRQTIKGRTRGR